MSITSRHPCTVGPRCLNHKMSFSRRSSGSLGARHLKISERIKIAFDIIDQAKIAEHLKESDNLKTIWAGIRSASLDDKGNIKYVCINEADRTKRAAENRMSGPKRGSSSKDVKAATATPQSKRTRDQDSELALRPGSSPDVPIWCNRSRPIL